MTVDPVEKYKKLLEKELKENDKWVLVDAKWLSHWKKHAKIEEADDRTEEPGELDFTRLVDMDTNDHEDGVQLKADAVEGNDYSFIPYELYEELKSQFGQKGNVIIRKVIPRQTNSDEYIIESILVPLRICSMRSKANYAKQIYRSRRAKIESLQRDICDQFSIYSVGRKLQVSTDEKGTQWEEIQYDSNTILEDVNILRNAYVTVDLQLREEKQVASTSYFTNHSSGYRTQAYTKSYTAGLCGLSNLGNTCFMNSALQCLSNVPALTDYFLAKSYLNHINSTNPLGMKGDVARAYGDLIEQMWSSKIDHYAPKELKRNVARYAPQFSGYNQQDSQEFMSFLLDGLHEDLNLVKTKPYCEKEDDDGRINDKELAEKHWKYYLDRNQSIIQNIFHGQIRSLLECLTCHTKARTFDPFCFLSLPLPDKKKNRRYRVEYVTLQGEIFHYSVKSDENGRMKDLVTAFCRIFQKKDDNPTGEQMEIDSDDPYAADEEEDELPEQDDSVLYKTPPEPDFIAATEVYSYRIHTLFRDDSRLTNILARDRIVFYQTNYSLKRDGDENILMPCTLRSKSYYKSSFGLPFYIALPRKDCKGKHVNDAFEALVDKFLPLSSVKNSKKPLYTAYLSFSDYGYQQPKLLSSMLEEPIDFKMKNVSLHVEVDEQVVDEYDRKEKERNSLSKKTAYSSESKKSKKKLTLNDCLKYFTSKETLSDDDLWFCPKCKERRKATKKMDLWRLPDVLIIQLKRFNYDRYWRDKIDIVVDFPIQNLDLSTYTLNPEDIKDSVYDLISISNHMGGLGGGHYTAYAKNKEDKEWHLFDDSYVSSVSEVTPERSAYVLIYERRKKQNSSNRVPSAREANASS